MKYNINLATKKKQTFFQQVSYFISHYLRYILVITQLVVIGVLFFRFRIDQSIIDLRESASQKEEIVKITSPLLAKAQEIEARSTSIQEILETQNQFLDMINYTFANFPADVYILKIEFNENSLILAGNTPRPEQLQQYLSTLKQERQYRAVKLEDIQRKDNEVAFSLKLEEFKNE